MSNPCLILDLTDFDKWSTSRGRSCIPEPRRPTVLHRTREEAEEEAIRLAGSYPGRLFAILEVTSATTTVKVPTQMSLAGNVVAERFLPRLVQVVSDMGDVPF